MPKINQLSFDVANLIAAGEVVERPASAAKELLENSIDAGATEVTVEICRGGIALIRVTDNGSGMEAEDLPVAIRRHATSKIKDKEDLAAIGTLGFRGEALAAISAVADITIITKTKEAAFGTMLHACGGNVDELCEVGCADGTSISVENLFENIPARRKFLKKDLTETQAVAAVVEKIAMSRPDVAIVFIADGIRKFSTPGDGVLLHTLHALFGKDFTSRLLKVEGASEDVSVSGFVGRPDHARGNRNHQNVFINGRYVRSKTVSAALERAFTSYMAPERFPVAVLFLDMPNFAVDVNVHPAKLEVKFSNEHAVFEAVYYAVRSALETDTARPYLDLQKNTQAAKNFALTHSFEKNEKAEQIRMTAPLRPEAPTVKEMPRAASRAPQEPLRPVTSAPQPVKAAYAHDRSFAEPKGSVLSAEESLRIAEKTADVLFAPKEEAKEIKQETLADAVLQKIAEETVEVSPPRTEDAVTPSVAKIPRREHTEQIPEHRVIGVLFRCYIMVELSEDKIMIIDQHAAHERILFEELKREREADQRSFSVELLLPLSVTLSHEEQAAAAEHKEELASLGFGYELRGNVAHLLAIPDALTPPEAESLFVSLCADIAEGGADPAVSEAKRREKMLYQIACKSAIKGGRSYDSAHIEWLVREVLSLPDVTVCPHGRPIAFYLTKAELDRRFDRLK